MLHAGLYRVSKFKDSDIDAMTIIQYEKFTCTQAHYNIRLVNGHFKIIWIQSVQIIILSIDLHAHKSHHRMNWTNLAL